MTTKIQLEAQSISTDVLLEKYAKGNETNAVDIQRRVSHYVASVESTLDKQVEWEEKFFQNMEDGAMGAGRIMSAAGAGIKATLINCFVQPVGDCIQGKDDEGFPGIYEAIREAAETMRRGGGVGYDFSRIRPRNAFVKGTHSFASGPCSYMDVFDASCKTVESAGSRRGAQMGVLKISHPDIMEFVTAKRTPGRWNNFNVSVFVTDAFMKAKNENTAWQLVHKAEPAQTLKDKGAFKREDGLWVYSEINAVELWNNIMKSNYDFAEPGILFEDNINNDNNLRYAERLEATNPCGEQPLPNYGCCDLGPINLTKFVIEPFSTNCGFNKGAFREAVAIQVRFLDNVLDATLWPLPQQLEESTKKRRVGVGFTGLGNTLAMLGLVYGSREALDFCEDIARTMRDSAYAASVDLAREKGAFPLFDADKYLEEGTFASRLPEMIKDDIRKYGIRNSHLLSIAPTGTVSLAFCDNASNGIEPPFSLAYLRKKRNSDNTTTQYPVVDHGLRVFLGTIEASFAEKILDTVCAYKTEFEHEGQTYQLKDVLPKSLITAMELTANEHLSALTVIQPYIDSAISKTVNVPADYPFEDFKKIYDNAHTYRLKGVSTYRPNNIIGSVLSLGTEEKKPEEKTKPVEKETPQNVDPLNVVIQRRSDNDLEAITKKVKYMTSLGDNTFYVSVSFENVKGMLDGVPVTVPRPVEVFITAYPDGVPGEWVAAYARALSLLARSGLHMFCRTLVDSRAIKSDKGSIRYGTYVKHDGTKVPRWHDSDVGCIAYAVQEILQKKGIIDEMGTPYSFKDIVTNVVQVHEEVTLEAPVSQETVMPGKRCTECGAHAVIKKDGCSYCTSCGYLGSCG